MKETCISTGSGKIKVYIVNTVVVGTGAAGYNAADCLYSYGQHDIAVVSEHVKAGTSRNTGSDKQTYYKLTLSGNSPDSVREMADNLFAGQCMDGDIALCEAALSVQGFLKLAGLGVPFPKNRWGEYIGYKTDHDPRNRATSVGPYTSKIMTECLERAVNEKKIPVFDKLQVIQILRDENRYRGILCLNLDKAENVSERFVAFCSENIIYATGGPAGIYADSVYPACHFGASGLAFEAGVRGRNLTEWQFGLASVNPRWNVSGTYMQVLPKFISRNPDGSDEREFLSDYFKDKRELLTNTFLKGYQWPFDVRKADRGSSIIDILVYMETCKGRKIYLDFRNNPGDTEVDYTLLSDEAREYLEKAEACFGTPYERLLHMNAPAVEFYEKRGINLSSQVLEIALCAQHNNGGLAMNAWWETNVPHFFAVGEVAGSHGVYRPGGSALNSGQAGSARAAQYIAVRYIKTPEMEKDFEELVQKAAEKMSALAVAAFEKGSMRVDELWEHAGRRMSRNAGAIRSREGIAGALSEVKQELEDLKSLVYIDSSKQLERVYRLRDMLIAQYVYLSAMADYMDSGGKSRGSALYLDPNGKKSSEQLPELFCFTLDDQSRSNMIQEISYLDGRCEACWRTVNPIPEEEDFFENIWRSYRENGNVY
ncbi:FAD-binding protein [Mediterraneibacter agrestimuris]|uniref:FAD-binding protein n=1 Tax=Mediterraneibacter agrestimuris TaxID=2941333 RepID=UPI00203E80F1|nr:FAD-binding protein [Mediterraneibacter agrestimuris]